MQGVAKLAQAGIGGYQMHQLDEDERTKDREAQALVLQAPGLQPSSAATGPSRQ